jgi:hypothetical protein
MDFRGPEGNEKGSNNSISRFKFLKMIAAGGIIVAVGGMGNIWHPFKRKTYAAATLPQNDYPFSYIIYKANPADPESETFAEKTYGRTYPDRGLNPIHDPNPEIIIQKVLDDPGIPGPVPGPTGPGHIYIRDGVYQLGPSFKGFNVKSYSTITMGPKAILKVPYLSNGYAEHVFKLEAIKGKQVTNCIIDGGVIGENHPKDSPPGRKWTAFLLRGVDEGVFFNKFVNTTMFNARVGVKLEAHSQPDGIKGGWVNGNSFQFLKMWQHGTFIDFKMIGPYAKGVPHTTGINRNNFSDLECQSRKQTSDNDPFLTMYGVKDVRHEGNSFINVKIWDFPDISPDPPRIPADAKIANITTDSVGTIILAGVMARSGFINENRNFVDLGKGTRILDQWNSPL